MDAGAYELLIAGFCRLNGDCDPAGLASSRHVEVDGVLVGLIPGEGDALHVFVEVAPSHPDLDAPVYRRLLAFNTERQPPLAGWFGLHPVGHGITYCLDLPAGIGPDDLSRILAEQIPLAGEAYRRLCTEA